MARFATKCLLLGGAGLGLAMMAQLTMEPSSNAKVAQSPALAAFAEEVDPLAKGEGEAQVKDGKLGVTARFPGVPLDMSAMIGWKKSKPPLRASFSFDFPYKGYLRAGQVSIETNLPSFPAAVNVDDKFRRAFRPRSNMQLEYELLARTSCAGENKPLRVVFMVRTRVVRFYDDGHLAFSAGPDEDGPTWAKGTPVRGPNGNQSEVVGRIEARPATYLPWSVLLIEAPPEAEAWFVTDFVRGTDEEPETLSLVHGFYEEVGMVQEARKPEKT